MVDLECHSKKPNFVDPSNFAFRTRSNFQSKQLGHQWVPGLFIWFLYIYIYYTHNLTRIQPNKKLIQQNSKPLIYETKRPHDPGSKDKTLIPFVKMGVEAREQTVPWGRESFLSRFYFEWIWMVVLFSNQQNVAGDVEEILFLKWVFTDNYFRIYIIRVPVGCLFVCLCFFLFVCFFVCLFVCCLFVCLFDCLFVCLFVCLIVCLFVCFLIWCILLSYSYILVFCFSLITEIRLYWSVLLDAMFVWLIDWFIHVYTSLRIQICPKEGIIPKILFWGWDWNPESYSREGSGFLGHFVMCMGCYL